MTEKVGMWRYKQMFVNELSDLPTSCHSFVYKITNLNNSKVYIGKKTLMSRRKKRYGKKKLAEMEDKRLRKYDWVIKETNWLTYTGSNKELNEDIANGDQVTREILQLCETKGLATYYEAKHQFLEGVIENDLSYNLHIDGKYYADKLFPNEDE